MLQIWSYLAFLQVNLGLYFGYCFLKNKNLTYLINFLICTFIIIATFLIKLYPWMKYIMIALLLTSAIIYLIKNLKFKLSTIITIIILIAINSIISWTKLNRFDINAIYTVILVLLFAIQQIIFIINEGEFKLKNILLNLPTIYIIISCLINTIVLIQDIPTPLRYNRVYHVEFIIFVICCNVILFINSATSNKQLALTEE